MDTDHLRMTMEAALGRGQVVEVAVPFFDGFQPISSIGTACEGWITFRLKGIDDATHWVPTNQVLGFRIRSNID